jgi:hypothetical protein
MFWKHGRIRDCVVSSKDVMTELRDFMECRTTDRKAEQDGSPNAR